MKFGGGRSLGGSTPFFLATWGGRVEGGGGRGVEGGAARALGVV